MEVAPDVLLVRDTCNVYVLRAGREAVLVDFGSGLALDRLDELGVDRVTDVLLTHHHRDQTQGLARAADAGIRIWVPPVEQELVGGVDRHWLERRVVNDYDLRQDRFSLLEQVPVAGVVAEYRTQRFGGFDVTALPTPGHTIGSVSYLVGDLAFTGDLVYGEGRVWSLAAMQWTYSGSAGIAATILSCGTVAARAPRLLLPSHGDPVDDPPRALARVRAGLQELLDMRVEGGWDLARWETAPWVEVTAHLLRNRTSFATSYALLSDSGGALIVDWGYDQATGVDLPTDRAGRRPLLSSIAALKRDHGVERIEVVALTHYHDDHVAGANLLRDVEGAAVWASSEVAPVLEHPERLDLPCLWFDPIPVDRRLEPGETVQWHEYELTTYSLPGHTRYAAGFSFDVDGKRVLATGDQQSGDGQLNYQYRNRFDLDDYAASAALYRRLAPDLLITGHWGVTEVTEAFLARLERDGRRVAELHRELLPVDVDFGAEGFGARIAPYRSSVAAGDPVELDVTVRNPFARPETALVSIAVPAGWLAQPVEQPLDVGPLGEATARFRVVPDAPAVKARVAADLTVGGVRFGQQAEALVDVR